jgi:hypothetical protein
MRCEDRPANSGYFGIVGIAKLDRRIRAAAEGEALAVQ